MSIGSFATWILCIRMHEIIWPCFTHISHLLMWSRSLVYGHVSEHTLSSHILSHLSSTQPLQKDPSQSDTITLPSEGSPYPISNPTSRPPFPSEVLPWLLKDRLWIHHLLHRQHCLYFVSYFGPHLPPLTGPLELMQTISVPGLSSKIQKSYR